MPVFETLHVQENRWRAMRFGIAAELIDLERQTPVPAREMVAEVLERVGRHAAPDGIARIHALAARDEPSEQRRLARRAGIPAITARAAEVTEAAAGVEIPSDGYTPGAWTTARSSRPTPTGR